MCESHSITEMLDQFKAGDEQAVRFIWERFYQRICGLARKRLHGVSLRTLDEEDVAQSAFHALCEGAERSSFRQLNDRNDVWQLLALITSRKATNVWRSQQREKIAGESAIATRTEGRLASIHEVVSNISEPEFLQTLSDTCETLFARLDDRLQSVVMLKLEGHSNEEISHRLNRSVKTIERYLKMIREKWCDTTFDGI